MTPEKDRAVARLTESLQLARASAKLAFHLRAMLRHRSSLARLSRDYSWLAMRVFRDGAVVYLWRVVDTQRSSRSLPWFIKTHSVLSESERREDGRRLSKSSSDVRRLGRLRHELFAHHGVESATRGVDQVLQDHNLSEAEFLTLIDDASSILRRHLGSPLSRHLTHSEQNAIAQIIDLDIYLDDAIAGRWGIERITPMIDGSYDI
jgi:hypothetical protein